MIRVNFAVLPCCFNVHAFVTMTGILLTSSSTLHSRKFQASHRYILTSACLCDFVSFGIPQIEACVIISIRMISAFANIVPV